MGEFIAFHDYVGDVNDLKKRIAGAVKNYPFSNGTKRKLWLTEFAVGCGKGSLCRQCGKTPYRNGQCNYPTSEANGLQLSDQLLYMKQAVPLLRKSPDIYRYAWFAGKISWSSFDGYHELGENNNHKTNLGTFYQSKDTSNRRLEAS